MKKSGSPYISVLFGTLMFIVANFNHVIAQPNADFSVSDSVGCQLSVDFIPKSDGKNLEHTWNFDNNDPESFEDTAVKNYTNAGIYTVKHVVNNTNTGKKDSVIKQDLIEVYGKPNANFNVSPKSGCKPLDVSITNNTTISSAPIASWTWDLGDGTIDTTKNPSHTYTYPGSYNINLIAKDANGCQDQATSQSINVSNAPTANFSAPNKTACTPPIDVNFTDQSQNPVGGSLSYQWDFGNGDSSTQQNPTHTYTSSGVYEVSLTVTDNSGCPNTETKSNFVVVDKAKADFNFVPQKGCAPLEVNFQNTTSPKLPNTSYQWELGDSTITSQANPVHTYTDSGSYNIKLKAFSGNNCVDSFTASLNVDPEPTFGFTSSQPFACEAPATVNFQSSGSNIVSYNWDFGNSKTSNSANPSNQYDIQGQFSVKLIIEDNNGCKDSLVKDSFVKITPPKPRFKIRNREGCDPLTSEFIDLSQSVDPITSWTWNFDNGATSNNQNPTHTYTNTGTYKPELAIETSQGCKDTVTEKEVRVGTKPNAQFNIPKKKGCLEDMNVAFQNLTNQNTPQADSFYWEFGDGKTSIKQNPTHQYDAPPDTVDVKLRAFNNGCPDSVIKQDSIILIAPFSEFSYEKASCREDSVYFKDLSVGADSLSWDLGDGTVTSDTMPAHEYQNQGQYTVKLEAFNDTTNCSHIEQKKINVSQNFNPNPIKTVSINNCARAIEVIYRPKDSAKLSWDYDNGRVDTFNNQFIKRRVTKFNSYDTPGTYTPKLEFESGNGCVIEDKGPQITADGTVPQFKVSPELGCIPLTIKLIDSTRTPVNPIDTMYYTMGNGDTIYTSQYDTVNYTFMNPAPNQNQGYPVVLHVRDSKNCIDTAVEYVQASKPRPKVAYSRDFFCDSVTYNFFAASADSNGLDPMSSYWEFGQNETFNKNVVTKTFSSDQNFNIKLVLTDAIGCQDSTNTNFTFDKNLPKAGFVSDTFKGDCPPLVTNFTDTSKRGYTGIKNWQWDFGDGSFSIKQNPEKVFIDAGQYDVKLTITDSANCVDSFVAKDYIVVDGPIGNYSFDTTVGCNPLDVDFSVTSPNAVNYQWDFDDGGSSNSQTPTHEYTRADTFKPTVELEDASGCEDIIGPIDSILVKPSPNIAFAMANPCFGYPTQFYDSTTTLKGQLTAWNWNFDGLGASNQQNPDFTFPGPDLYDITLEVDNSLGCSSQKSKEFDIGGLEVGFSAKDSNICLGNPVDFIDETFADNTITSWQWDFGNGGSSTRPNPTLNYEQPGAYDVTLIANDVEGCSDTVTKPNYINVADTIPPPPPEIHRVTVQSDNAVKLDFGEFKGFGFKYYTVYRQANNGSYQRIGRINDKYDTSYIDSLTNPLTQPQCYKVTVTNSCDLSSQIDQARQHCTVELTAEVDTNQANLDWTPYVGWDTVERYNILRQKVDTHGSYFKIGEVPGNQTSYSDTDIVCYQRYTYKIQAVDQSPNPYTYSLSDTSGARPIYKADFPPNNLIKATVVDDENIRLEWEPPKQTEVAWYSIERWVAGNQSNKSTYIVGDDQLSYLDESVLVDSNSYVYRGQPFDTCEAGGPYSNIGKTILLETEVTENLRPRLKWTKYREWESGVDYYHVEIMQNDGSFKKIHQTTGPDQTTYTDTITDLNTLNQYCYRIVAQKNDGFGNDENGNVESISNVDCVTGLSKLYVPNAFSPNDDGINDFFVTKGLYIQKFNIKIYDRWGTKVFETSDINKKWDGTFKGKRSPEDVYIYVVQALGIDGESHSKTGKLLLLRK